MKTQLVFKEVNHWNSTSISEGTFGYIDGYTNGGGGTHAIVVIPSLNRIELIKLNEVTYFADLYEEAV